MLANWKSCFSEPHSIWQLRLHEPTWGCRLATWPFCCPISALVPAQHCCACACIIHAQHGTSPTLLASCCCPTGSRPTKVIGQSVLLSELAGWAALAALMVLGSTEANSSATGKEKVLLFHQTVKVFSLKKQVRSWCYKGQIWP